MKPRMKKFLFLIFIFSQSNFCHAQTAFKNSTSFRSNSNFLKEKNRLLSHHNISLEFGLNTTNLFSNRTSASVYQSITNGASALIKFKAFPSIRYNASINYTFPIIHDNLGIVAGVGFIKRTFQYRCKIESQPFPDSEKFSNLIFLHEDIYFPFSLKYKFTVNQYLEAGFGLFIFERSRGYETLKSRDRAYFTYNLLRNELAVDSFFLKYSYEFKSWNILAYPFAELNYIKSSTQLYLQVGINIKLLKKN